MAFQSRSSTLIAGTPRRSFLSSAASRSQAKRPLSIFKRGVSGRVLAFLCLTLAASAIADASRSNTFVGRLLFSRGDRGRFGPTRLGASAPASLSGARQRSARTGGTGQQWQDKEDWALMDETPAFTVGDGANAATFWTALASASTELGQRSSAELQERMEELAEERNMRPGFYGREPVLLSSWARLPDGRFTGSVDGRVVWLTTQLEGRLPSDPRDGPGYIVSLGGCVYELGEPSAPVEPKVGLSSASPPAAAQAAQPEGSESTQVQVLQGLQSFVAFLSVALLSGGVGVYAGVNGLVQLPGQNQQVITVKVQKAPPSQTTSQALPQRATSPNARTPPKAAGPKREAAQLLLSEQRVRQEIQVDKLQANIDTLEAKLTMDAGRIDASVSAEEARLQTNRERQVITDKERVKNLGTRLKADIERGKNKLAQMKLKLREDQEQLAELQRIEKERGPSAMAVEMSVLPAGSDAQKP